MLHLMVVFQMHIPSLLYHCYSTILLYHFSLQLIIASLSLGHIFFDLLIKLLYKFSVHFQWDFFLNKQIANYVFIKIDSFSFKDIYYNLFLSNKVSHMSIP